MLKRFIAYYKPHKFMFAMDMLASLLISVIGMVYPIVTRRMLNDLIPNKNFRGVVYAGLIVLGLTCCALCFVILSSTTVT